MIAAFQDIQPVIVLGYRRIKCLITTLLLVLITICTSVTAKTNHYRLLYLFKVKMSVHVDHANMEDSKLSIVPSQCRYNLMMKGPHKSPKQRYFLPKLKIRKEHPYLWTVMVIIVANISWTHRTHLTGE